MTPIRLQHTPCSMKTAWLLSIMGHLLVLALFVFWEWYSPTPTSSVTYYVDLANLPVASPASGSPTAVEPSASRDTAPPASTPVATRAPMQPTTPRSAPTDESSFAERMAAIRSHADKQKNEQDARRQAATYDDLRRRVASRSKGTPGGSGSEAGSDYTSYLQSRFKDAFEVTISYQTKAPYVLIAVYVDARGRITRARIDKSSGDRVFELAVQRAISMAERTITPPPSKSGYEGVFVFKPQGVSLR
ncbi:MAG: TonB family protein [Trichlorobacter sp.]|jgi:colicin import membrane protein